jgi:hypothetical protein
MLSSMVAGSHTANPLLELLTVVGAIVDAATVGATMDTSVGVTGGSVGASVGSGIAIVVDGELFCMATMAL